MSSALRGLTGFILLLLLTVSALLLTTAQSAAQDIDEDEPTPPPIPITGDELRNLSYPNEWPADGVAPLTDGVYTEPIPDSVAQVGVEFRRAAFGQLDGRAAAAVRPRDQRRRLRRLLRAARPHARRRRRAPVRRAPPPRRPHRPAGPHLRPRHHPCRLHRLRPRRRGLLSHSQRDARVPPARWRARTRARCRGARRAGRRGGRDLHGVVPRAHDLPRAPGLRRAPGERPGVQPGRRDVGRRSARISRWASVPRCRSTRAPSSSSWRGPRPRSPSRSSPRPPPARATRARPTPSTPR